MSKIQPPSDTAPALAVCPTCGRPPLASCTRRDAGMIVGDYRDDAGHIWTTRWLESA